MALAGDEMEGARRPTVSVTCRAKPVEVGDHDHGVVLGRREPELNMQVHVQLLVGTQVLTLCQSSPSASDRLASRQGFASHAALKTRRTQTSNRTIFR